LKNRWKGYTVVVFVMTLWQSAWDVTLKEIVGV
jgi:hypothetical protein